MKNSRNRNSDKRLKSSTYSRSEDRISDLPDDIIQHILSFLRAKDAIKTSFLSKRWESLWTSIPNLLFHCEYFSQMKVHKFASFVDKTLMKYACTKMNKFSLQCHFYQIPYDQVELWLLFVKNHEVKEISLQLQHKDFMVKNKWLECMYTDSSVTKMSLNSFLLDQILEGFYWTSLKILSFTDSTLGNHTIRSILEGSPLLECLTLQRCELCDYYDLGGIDTSGTNLKALVIDGMQFSGTSPIDITAPNLLSLTIVQFTNDPTFNLVDVSSLLEANVDVTMGMLSYSHKKKMLIDLLQNLGQVNKLTVGIRCCQDHSTENAICARFSPATLKSLEVDIKSMIGYRAGLSALLYCSPDVEQLTINLMPFDHCEEKFFCNKKYLRQPLRPFLIRHLKSVKIIVHGLCSHSYNILFKLVKYLLRNANILQKLIIDAGGESSSSVTIETFSKLYEITQKLLSYPRASTDAVVLVGSRIQ